ncbi:MAG: hypothetical protein JWL77_3529 [Chthonomonadaceae bacterium]|nr:hypothetical protein [Chthonomonadaceae bacterium]
MMHLTNPLITVNVNTLSKSESIQLANCETTVADGRKHFVLVGNALMTIRDNALYRGTHETFENYLRDKWDMSRGYGYKQIEAATTVANLSQMSPIGDMLPDNEAQARALSGLAPEQQQQVWQQVMRVSDGKPTARVVRDVAQEYRPTPSVSSKPGDKRQMVSSPITVNFAERTQEETGADYHTLWQAEKERADNLQNQVRALKAEVARLLSGVEGNETEVKDIAPTTEEKQDARNAPISADSSDLPCPLCSAPDYSQCACDADAVNALLEQARSAAKEGEAE